MANRGEIALRIARAARELAIKPIAVYSDADRRSAHVMAAAEAHRIGDSPPDESYLRGERLVELALRAGADAVHPGYGFLSERAAFAKAVEDAGLIFVGPRPETIAAMGDKVEARRVMKKAGVPVVPGSPGPVTEPKAAALAASEVGYPVLIKAVAGGGGKGMRVVEDPAEIANAFQAASREAMGAFGDGSLYVERCLNRPRHIEVQVLGDGRGNVIHLGERECSIQRRHQKLVEEAPAPQLGADERERLYTAAIGAAEAVSYRGAGTIEFLFEDGKFYFVEMNTRIQVEHPVTEMVTGIDLLHAQLHLAGGGALDYPRSDLSRQGHAIECRITAEDDTFLPATGVVREIWIPGGPGVRWDGGVVPGQAVTLDYDSLLGKLIVHAPTRELAIARMNRALGEMVIAGVETTIPFHRRLLAHPDFRAGRLSIRFLEDHPELSSPGEHALEPVAALAASLRARDAYLSGAAARIDPPAAQAAWSGSEPANPTWSRNGLANRTWDGNGPANPAWRGSGPANPTGWSRGR